MYTIYPNYVALQNQNAASTTVYANYVGLNNRKVDDDDHEIHARMLEQGTLHRCAMLRYNKARQSSAKLEQLKRL